MKHFLFSAMVLILSACNFPNQGQNSNLENMNKQNDQAESIKLRTGIY